VIDLDPCILGAAPSISLVLRLLLYALPVWNLKVVVFTRPDPFNYPMPQRSDCMSLSSIRVEKDGMKTTTFKFQTGRA
jgi:hypothetical protein